jgi:lipopolysaccharide transport system ATP-binding protein
MYMRLAFAVAAHLESEILIVDEVLSVGDNRFQNKCLNKMQEVGEQGRTVLFVSHSIPAVTRLCNKAILLDEGRLLEEGPAIKIARSYFSKGLNYIPAEHLWQNQHNMPGGEVARLYAVRVKAENGETTEQVKINRPVEIEMEYDVIKSGYKLIPHFHLFNQEGTKIFTTLDIDPEWRKQPRPRGRYSSRVMIPGSFLQEGLHVVWAGLITIEPMIVQFYEKDTVMFQVLETNDRDTARGDYAGNIDGAVRPLLKWTTSYNANI